MARKVCVLLLLNKEKIWERFFNGHKKKLDEEDYFIFFLFVRTKYIKKMLGDVGDVEGKWK